MSRQILFDVTYKDNTFPVCETVYNYKEVSLDKKAFQLVKKGKKKKYYNIMCAFDIETSSIRGNELKDSYGFMYLWQCCISDIVFMGRRWSEFFSFLDLVVEQLDLCEERFLVLYVHNLAYEWSYIKEFLYRWSSDIKGFFTNVRIPLFIQCLDKGIELRCSYKLTNMGLASYLSYCDTIYQKKGNYDYKKLRTPDTPLNDEELGYGYCDVRGLCDGLRNELKHWTIANIPLTSTGMVRRDTRNSFKEYDKYRSGEYTSPKWKNLYEKFDKVPSSVYGRYKTYSSYIKDTAIDMEFYKLLREASRGGDTHANALKSGILIKDVWSHDKVSSYPWQQLSKRYPMGKWKEVEGSEEKLKELSIDETKSFLCRLYISEIMAKKHVRSPYLSENKCLIDKEEKNKSFKGLKEGKTDVSFVVDNGRVLKAKGAVVTLTNVDYDILCRDYDFKIDLVDKLYVCEADYLPEPLRGVILMYFYGKCELKGGDPYLYMKSKNKLNGIFGMCFTNICHTTYTYNPTSYIYEATEGTEKELKKYFKNRDTCLRYEWGVWCSAWGRWDLHQGYEIIGPDAYIYGDTDSVKWADEKNGEKILKKFDKANAYLKTLAEHVGAYYSYKGKEYYMGQWEDEGKGQPLYQNFKCFGAKKYGYTYQDGTFGITVAGLAKEKGARFFKKIENFKLGISVPETDSGRTTAVYQDEPIHTIEVEGVEIETASSCSLFESTYTLGVSTAYELLLNQKENFLNVQ